MKVLIIVFLLITAFLLPGFLYSAQISNVLESESETLSNEELARQEAVIASEKTDAEQIKANAESEEMRLKSEQELAESLKQAEADLQTMVEDFQEQEYPQLGTETEELEEE